MLGLNTPLKQAIFAAYVALWVACHLLVYASQHGDSPAYNATSVVMITELVKLMMALGLYLRYDACPSELVSAISREFTLLLKYAVPAVLYAFYNNLVYTNLAAFDPGTYNVLMQMKIAMTGILYQWLFSKHLNRNQWLAILLITLGCMCKESNKLTTGSSLQANLTAWLLLLCQMLCSVFAGVYNEALLKGPGVDARKVSTNLQNAFMYSQSVVVNAFILLWQGQLGEAFSANNLSAILSIRVLAIICIMSSVGLITGFFLKHLDSVLKSIAAAVEVVFTMLLSYFFFGTPLEAMGIIAACIVGGGVALYSVHPRPPIGREAAESELKSVTTTSAEKKGNGDGL